MQKAQIVKFGKYKGRPIYDLAEDESYKSWLLSQSWLEKKHPIVFNFISNHAKETHETPEHNRMQVRFLDESFRRAFVLALLPKMGYLGLCEEAAGIVYKETWRSHSGEGVRDHLVRIRNAKLPQKKWINTFVMSKVEVGKPFFETSSGLDVYFYFKIFNEFIGRQNGSYIYSEKEVRSARLPIEIKPSVSDDYPAVLRQMKRSNAFVLYLEEYTGKGADKRDFVNFFDNEGILVLFHKDITVYSSQQRVKRRAKK